LREEGRQKGATLSSRLNKLRQAPWLGGAKMEASPTLMSRKGEPARRQGKSGNDEHLNYTGARREKKKLENRQFMGGPKKKRRRSLKDRGGGKRGHGVLKYLGDDHGHEKRACWTEQRLRVTTGTMKGQAGVFWREVEGKGGVPGGK